MKPGIPQVISMLKDSKWNVRQSVTDALGRFADHRE
jgi:HEAT repeat protein